MIRKIESIGCKTIESIFFEDRFTFVRGIVLDRSNESMNK